MNREMKWIATLVFALMVAGLFVACGDDATSATAPSVVSGDAGFTGLAGARSQGSRDDDDDSDDPSDDASDDTSDDDSGDDDSSGGTSGSLDDGDGDRVRGLFLGMEIEGCPADSGCVVAVRIKDTLVIVTDETRVDNEPALVEGLPPSQLAELLAVRFGLPLRARGVRSGDDLVATRFRIDDEIRATGEVVAPAMGCVGDMGLLFRPTLPPLCFELSGLRAPAMGSTVRVEGRVPADLVSPYLAVAIERID